MERDEFFVYGRFGFCSALIFTVLDNYTFKIYGIAVCIGFCVEREILIGTVERPGRRTVCLNGFYAPVSARIGYACNFALRCVGSKKRPFRRKFIRVRNSDRFDISCRNAACYITACLFLT